MGYFTWKKSLLGMGAPQTMTATATDAAISHGDLLMFDTDGKVLKATSNVKPNLVAGVAISDCEANGTVTYIPISDMDYFECTATGTIPKVGGMVDLSNSAGVQSVVISTSNKIARVEKIVDATAKTLWIRFIGLAGNQSTT
jgi:hypothetical protein